MAGSSASSIDPDLPPIEAYDDEPDLVTTSRTGHDGGIAPSGHGSPRRRETRARPARRTASTRVTDHPAGPILDRTVAALAGPDALGRGIVVAPDQPVPAPWDAAPRVVIDTTDATRLGDAMDALQRAWSERRRIVIELSVPLDAQPVLDAPWWELSPRLELGHERLAHLVHANTVDARDRTGPRFAPLAMAIALGATPAPCPATEVGYPGPDRGGDIVVDHTPRWCDGGPLDRPDPTTVAGLGIVPAANLGAGSLQPLQDTPGARVGLDELAADQLAAVTHVGAGARIIAPAGSGKTRVLTERARHLVHDRGVDARAICLVAFNVRAREEMQQRTADIEGLEVRTLNSLALAICNGSGAFAPSTGGRVEVIDEPVTRRMLDDLVPRRRQAMTDPIAAWIEALTASRLGLRAPADVEADFGGDVKGFTELGPAYVERLRRAGKVDFDQQILRAIEILCTDPGARAAARRACAVLLVDELQDLTPAHIVLVRLLAGPRADVFGVGDDDQTIYGYAGASPEWLIDFDALFPGSATHDLEVNYRCPARVVEAAATLLTHNRRRVDKTIRPGPAAVADPDALRATAGDRPVDVLVEHVRSLVDNGTRPADIAVLTRVNATLLAPLIALDDAGIGCHRPVEAGFIGRTGVSAALAWLELATAPERRLAPAALGVAARRPPRALHGRVVDWLSEKQSVREIEQFADRLRDDRDTAKVRGFADHLAAVRALADSGADTRRLLEAVRDLVGLGGALESRLDASRRSVDRSSHGDDLSALLAIADLHPDPGDFGPWLEQRLRSAVHDPRGVRLATIHKVKGREWPHVVVYEATAGIMPHRLADAVEEERRVFHVGLTRGSMSVLVVSGSQPSPFVAQMTVARDLREPATDSARTGTRADRGAARRGPVRSPVGSTLDIAGRRERLRSWRSDRSRRDGVPAFVVFSDATLIAIAEQCPDSEEALLAISGIGPTKLERYGNEVLALLAECAAERGPR